MFFAFQFLFTLYFVVVPCIFCRAFCFTERRKTLIDKKFMEKAIELARKGSGWTNPNPMVGAVIVKDGEIIGEGYHQKYGNLHAERNAIASLKESAEGATIYVTLEPCCHHGKTPPCTEAIIEAGIKTVVIGSRDPNPLVAGKGVKILREAGIEVVTDYMREECDKINLVFFHYITKRTPYVIMKYAMTADGKICTITGESKWVTGELSRNLVQLMRHKYMGIMVGIGTVLVDDPMLNVRVAGMKSPIRIICDSNLRIPVDCKIVETAKDIRTIVACAKVNEKKVILEEKGVIVVECPGEDEKVDIKNLMIVLGNMGIDSILVEGGGTLNWTMVSAGIVNEVQCFIAPKMFGGVEAKSPVEGMGCEVPSEALELEVDSITNIGEDILIRYLVKEK